MNMHVKQLPSREECYQLMQKFGMYDNIVKHSEQVERIALAIADNLIDKNILNRTLLSTSALLHDIAKAVCIETKDRRHDNKGGQIMRELGYADIAVVIESHVIIDGYDQHGPLQEREIVFYADKRVMHDEIVSVDTRITDLVKRYGVSEEIIRHIKGNKVFIVELEKKIQSYLGKNIEDIIQNLIDA